jgi:hypothetical protein
LEVEEAVTIYSAADKKIAKRVKRIAQDEGRGDHPEWSHTRVLNIVQRYERNGMSAEEFAAHIYVTETAKGRGVPEEPDDAIEA